MYWGTCSFFVIFSGSNRQWILCLPPSSRVNKVGFPWRAAVLTDCFWKQQKKWPLCCSKLKHFSFGGDASRIRMFKKPCRPVETLVSFNLRMIFVSFCPEKHRDLGLPCFGDCLSFVAFQCFPVNDSSCPAAGQIHSTTKAQNNKIVCRWGCYLDWIPNKDKENSTKIYQIIDRIQ